MIKVYTDAEVLENGNLKYGHMVVSVPLARPLNHRTITVETKPQGECDHGGVGCAVLKVIQDGEVLYE